MSQAPVNCAPNDMFVEQEIGNQKVINKTKTAKKTTQNKQTKTKPKQNKFNFQQKFNLLIQSTLTNLPA